MSSHFDKPPNPIWPSFSPICFPFISPFQRSFSLYFSRFPFLSFSRSILIHPFLVSKPSFVFITSHVSYRHFHDVNVQFSESEIYRHKRQHGSVISKCTPLANGLNRWHPCFLLWDQNAAIVITSFKWSQFQDLNVVSVWTQTYLILKIILLFSELQVWFLMANWRFRPE